MVEGYKRSRSMRRVKVKLPGGTTTTHYKRRKPSKAKCGECSAVLPGVASERPIKMQKMTKSKKTPSRPYGGNLCSKCTRSLILEKARLA